MKTRATLIAGTIALAICVLCPLVDMFDQWDHALQTGNDSEYPPAPVADGPAPGADGPARVADRAAPPSAAGEPPGVAFEHGPPSAAFIPHAVSCTLKSFTIPPLMLIVIGGADGLAEPVVQRAGLALSLGVMTWPHLLARILLLEQLYRTQQILAGHPYHRD